MSMYEVGRLASYRAQYYLTVSAAGARGDGRTFMLVEVPHDRGDSRETRPRR